MKMAVFRDAAPYSAVADHRSFRGACCFYDQGDSPVATMTEISTAEKKWPPITMLLQKY
jgi:hypothetical protein